MSGLNSTIFIGIFENLEKILEIHAKTREQAQNRLEIIQKCTIQAGHLLRWKRTVLAL